MERMEMPLPAEDDSPKGTTDKKRISMTAMSLLEHDLEDEEWMSLSIASSYDGGNFDNGGADKNIICRDVGVYEMTGFLCNDLSGHARLNLDLQLTCSSYKFLKQSFFDSKVLPLPPDNDLDSTKDKKKVKANDEEDNEEKGKEAAQEENATPLWEKELQSFSKDQSFEEDDIDSSHIITKKKIQQKQNNKTKFDLQCQSILSNNNDVVIVEQVSILETFWMDNESSDMNDAASDLVNSGFSIGLKVQVLLQAATNNDAVKTKKLQKKFSKGKEENNIAIPDHYLADLDQRPTKTNNNDNADIIKTNLSFTATLSRPSSSSPLLTSKTILQSLQQSASDLPDDDDDQDDDQEDDVALGFAALDMASNSCLKSIYPNPINLENDDSITATQEKNLRSINMSLSNEDHTMEILTTSHDSPLVLKLLLVPALTLKIQEIGAPRAATGATLVNLIIQHSNLHNSHVTVTNLALHPGHVRMLSPLVQHQHLHSNAMSSYHKQDDNDNDNHLPKFQRGTSAGTHDDSSVMTFPAQLNHSNHNHPTLGQLSIRSSMAFPHFPQRPSIVDSENPTSSYSRMLRNSISVDANPSTKAISIGRAISGGELSVMDMSGNVRWAYAPGTSLSFPFVLKPYEAIATVLQIDAVNQEEWQSGKTFLAPLALTAFCGETNHNTSPRKNRDSNEQLLVSADIQFTTAPSIVMAASNDDAFRIDMALKDPDQCPVVGAPVIVSLRVTNLSNDTKDLMLLMAKDEDRASKTRKNYRPSGGTSTSNKSSSTNSSNSNNNNGNSHSKQKPTVHTAVVSEVNGYTFGVWGLLSNNSALHDDGTLRYHRDHELLAVDAALLLGEVKSNQTMDAELRFVPLREGTLDIPNLKLYDKIAKRWYSCVHMLKIVAAAVNTITTNPELEEKK